MTAPHEVQRRSVSPLVLMICVPLVAMVGMLGVLMVAQRFVAPEGLTEYEQRLPDGSILKVEAVTWGQNHNYMHQVPQTGFNWFVTTGPHALNMHSLHEQVGIYMTRRHGQSGMPLDFDWWQGNVVIDAFDDEVQDMGAMFYQYHPHGGMSGGSGDRPFKADPGTYSSWVVYSTFFPNRPAGGRLKFRVKNTKGEVVANFDLPHPTPPSAYPVWKADSLPKTMINGELEVTLKSIFVTAHEYESNGRIQYSTWANPDAEFNWQGQPTSDWHCWGNLKNQLGVSLGEFSQLPSQREKIWQAEIYCAKTANAFFPESERLLLENLTFEEHDSSKPEIKGTVDGEEISIVAMGGPGPQSFEIDSSLIGMSGHAHDMTWGQYVFEKSFEWRVRTNGGGRATVKFDTPFHWLSLRTSGAFNNKTSHFKVKDDQGRQIEVGHGNQHSNMRTIYLRPAADMKSISLEILAHAPQRVSCFVELPELKVERLQKATNATAQP